MFSGLCREFLRGIYHYGVIPIKQLYTQNSKKNKKQKKTKLAPIPILEATPNNNYIMSSANRAGPVRKYV